MFKDKRNENYKNNFVLKISQNGVRFNLQATSYKCIRAKKGNKEGRISDNWDEKDY